MGKQRKVRLRVTEIVRHSFFVEMSDEEIKELESMGEDDLAGLIGDMTSRSTIDDGAYEDPEIGTTA